MVESNQKAFRNLEKIKDEYLLGEIIGHGTFPVQLAERRSDSKEFAMKTIIDPTAQHFEEARILKSLQHDNIIRTEEVFTSNKGKKLHIVMEHAEGKFVAFD